MKAIFARLCGALACIGMLTVAASAQAANVGYYDMCQGQGDPLQVTPITSAGQTPVNITDLSPAELAGIDMLFVDNCSNGGYGAEYLSALSAIQDAVNSGMVLMIHDRTVDGANTILPGGGSFSIVRDFSDDTDINVIDDSTLITHGPGGVIDNTTLDNGSSSSHGYAVLGTLPGDGVFILSRGNPAEIVSFSYPYGAGWVYYSSIPLDYYLDGTPPAAFSTIYAVNAVAYGVGEFTGRQYAQATPVPAMGRSGLVLLAALVLGFGLYARRRFSC